MGNETILYYAFEETFAGYEKRIKTYFWQRIKPLTFMALDDELTIEAVLIPAIDKGYSRKKLLDIMRAGVKEYPEVTETLLHPKLSEFFMRPEDCPEIFWKLADKLLEKNSNIGKQILANGLTSENMGMDEHRAVDSVVFLTGGLIFPTEQLQRFTDMLQPYFPKINHLNVIYEKDEETGEADERLKAAIDECMEELYYEYGLVGEVCGSKKEMGFLNRRFPALYIDYGYKGPLPYGLMKAGGVYIDIPSSTEKECSIVRKCPKISYISPRKYLDTIVKSGYDRLVNQA